ncbi:hypothetical protein [Clostridium sp. UBA7339]
MVKIKLSYEKQEDMLKILKQLSKDNNIRKISEPNKTGGFYRVYIELE